VADPFHAPTAVLPAYGLDPDRARVQSPPRRVYAAAGFSVLRLGHESSKVRWPGPQRSSHQPPGPLTARRNDADSQLGKAPEAPCCRRC